MNINDIEKLTKEKLTEYNLNTWHVVIGNGRRLYGCCRYSKKEIWLSLQFINSATDEQILDVILHEIAHALVGLGIGHGKRWKVEAKKLGAIPKSIVKGINIDMAWIATCSKCGKIFNRMKRTKQGKIYLCNKCHVELKYKRNDKFINKAYN